MFDQTVEAIKNLQIQGATNIAKRGLEALYERAKELRDSGFKKESLEPSVDILREARATEPGLRNVLSKFMKLVRSDLGNIDPVYEQIQQWVTEAVEKAKQFAANLIEDNMVLFTHCHSGDVTAAIIQAKLEGKKFEVYNTETRPRYQGRITAQELANNGIQVHHMVDSAGYHVLRKADLFLFGADAINSYGNVFNKVGTKMFCEIATKYNVKTFCVTSSLKFDPETMFGKSEKIEQRAPQEVWDIQNSYIEIFNPAFDEVEKEHIDGIVSEYGVLSPESFVTTVKEEFS